MTEQAEVRRDCAGIVRRTGFDRSSKLQIGDRVCVLGASLCQSYARTSHDPVALVPDNMTFEQAATLPFRSWLALYLVNEVAGLTKIGQYLFMEVKIPLDNWLCDLLKKPRHASMLQHHRGSLRARFATNLQYRKVLDLRLG